MSEWKEFTIEQLGKVITGKTPSKNNPEEWGDNYNFITPSDYGAYNKFALSSIRKLSDIGYVKHKSRLIPTDSLLVTCIGSDMGKVVKNSYPCFTNQQINSFIPNENIVNSDFIYYFFKSSENYLKNLGSDGSAVPILNKSTFQQIGLDLPPLPEQQAIASVLSALDDKIDLLQRQNQTLEHMAATLFRQWFIEEAKEDWEEVRVSDIAIHIKNSINPNKFPTTLFKHFSLPAFDNGQNPSIESGQEILSSKYQLESNSILVSKLNPIVPRVWMILKADNNFISSTEFQNFKPKNRNYLGFLYFLFKADTVIEQLAMSASGTSGSHQRVKPQDMLDIKFTTSNLNLVEKFSLMVESTLIKQHENLKQIRTLQSMRDTLLPKLISGEVRLKGFETVLQA